MILVLVPLFFHLIWQEGKKKLTSYEEFSSHTLFKSRIPKLSIFCRTPFGVLLSGIALASNFVPIFDRTSDQASHMAVFCSDTFCKKLLSHHLLTLAGTELVLHVRMNQVEIVRSLIDGKSPESPMFSNLLVLRRALPSPYTSRRPGAYSLHLRRNHSNAELCCDAYPRWFNAEKPRKLGQSGSEEEDVAVYLFGHHCLPNTVPWESGDNIVLFHCFNGKCHTIPSVLKHSFPDPELRVARYASELEVLEIRLCVYILCPGRRVGWSRYVRVMNCFQRLIRSSDLEVQ